MAPCVNYVTLLYHDTVRTRLSVLSQAAHCLTRFGRPVTGVRPSSREQSSLAKVGTATRHDPLLRRFARDAASSIASVQALTHDIQNEQPDPGTASTSPSLTAEG